MKYLDKVLSQGWAEILGSRLGYFSTSPPPFAHPSLQNQQDKPGSCWDHRPAGLAKCSPSCSSRCTGHHRTTHHRCSSAARSQSPASGSRWLRRSSGHSWMGDKKWHLNSVPVIHWERELVWLTKPSLARQQVKGSHADCGSAKCSSPTSTPFSYVLGRTGTVVMVMTMKANYGSCGKREEPAKSAELLSVLQYSQGETTRTTALWPSYSCTNMHVSIPWEQSSSQSSPYAPSNLKPLLNSGVPDIASDKCVCMCVRVRTGFSYLWEIR